MKRIKKVEESSALIGKVFDSFETDSHQDAPSIYAVRNAISNHNLLVNGDFRTPINQRGEEVYDTSAGNAYTIDRWRANGLVVTVNSNSITITNNNAAPKPFIQPRENILYSGYYTATINILNLNGNISIRYYDKDNNLRDEQENLVLGKNTKTINNSISVFGILLKANSSIELEYIKLEQGSIATPLVPKLYAEELILCKRYFQIVFLVESDAYSAGRYFKGLVFPIEMRKVPTYKAKFTEISTDISTDLDRVAVYNNRIGAVVFKSGHAVMSGIVELDAEIY